MTDKQSPSNGEMDPVLDLLRQALNAPPKPKHDFLPRVQQKIRLRTKGRYFRDRWSTSRNPASLIFLCTLLLLILCAALFLVIQPLVDAPVPTDLERPPIDPLAREPLPQTPPTKIRQNSE